MRARLRKLQELLTKRREPLVVRIIYERPGMPPLVPSEEAVAAARERAIREGLEVVVVYPEVSWPEEEDNTEK